MRITKRPVEPDIKSELALLLPEPNKVADIQSTQDFIEDIYSMFATDLPISEVLLNDTEIFNEVIKRYSLYEFETISGSAEFQSEIRNVLGLLSRTSIFMLLQKLDALEATKIVVETWGADFASRQDQEQTPQPGISGDKDSLPIDMQKFSGDMSTVMKMVDMGLFEETASGDFLRERLGVGGKKAGIGSGLQALRDMKNVLDRAKFAIRADKTFKTFQVAHNLEQIEVYENKAEVVDVVIPQNEMTIDNIKNNEDLLRLLPSEYMLDSNEFNYKLAKKELLKKQYQDRHQKAQALYLLVDSSGSMNGDSSTYAAALTIALLEKAIDQKAKFFLRFFDWGAHELKSATTREDAKKVIEYVMNRYFDGGGTDIRKAVEEACDDIRKDKIKFDKMEIMLITDGEDGQVFDKEMLKVRDEKGEREIKMHLTQIGNHDNRALIDVSSTYRKYNAQEIDKIIKESLK